MSVEFTMDSSFTSAPLQIELTVDNPHMLINGAVGTGKTTACRHIIEANQNINFVYLGQADFHMSSPLDLIAPENFFALPEHYRDHYLDPEKLRVALHSLLESAILQANQQKAVLVIEEFTQFISYAKSEFFELIGWATGRGLHIIFTSPSPIDCTILRRIAPGALAVMSPAAPETRYILEELSAVYPEFKGAPLIGEVGKFLVRVPGGSITGNLSIPDPMKVPTAPWEVA